MAKDSDTLVPKSYRLPVAQVDFIEALTRSGIFGSRESEVVRTLLERAIKELVETDYARKHIETLKALHKAAEHKGKD